ncbi:MAG: excinuclease ABC subunit C [Cyclobacteriaceae bacterium]|nr:excinuclease ABC subunit C [Cyclobacteriaceae bacterium]
MTQAVREQLASLPDEPGIYRFYNKDHVLIYVGKAKNLKKRVSSYFLRQATYHRKTEKLVSEIAAIEFTLVSSEFDALLMENNFIKQYQPKYNILLKDDKTFPYLCILRERFPRIISTRKYLPQQGEYFGPYSSVQSMKSVLELVRKLYSIRTCNLLLSESNISKGKFKVCLEYHLGNCKGPCVGYQGEASYLEEIAQARYVLKGNLSEVEGYFHAQMLALSNALQFEQAEKFRHKLELLERFQAKSTVVNRKLTDIDVITIVSTDEKAYVNFMQVKEGAIVYSRDLEFSKKLDESDGDILSLVAHQLRTEVRSPHTILYSNLPLTTPGEGIENVIPQIGDKRRLIDLSLKNALYQKVKGEALRETQTTRNLKVLEVLQKDLRLQRMPRIIECFDNSNFQGSNPVASMVRFVDGKPHKAGYRHFNIRTVEGPNDFASMKEIVGRRYKRLADEGEHFPDLILVDGGKGQLSSAVEALQELGLYGKIPIAGIAKKLEEIYYPDDPLPMHIHKKSPGLMLIQQIRDEAHRFAITFHRKKRSHSSLHTELNDIPGIGPAAVTALLARFKSLKKIQEATPDQLAEVVGKSKASKVIDWQQKREA